MSEASEPKQSAGIPSWVLSGAAVAILGGALWWGTRDAPVADPVRAQGSSQVGDQSAGGEAAPEGVESTGTQDAAMAANLLERGLELERAGDLAGALVLAKESASAGGGTPAWLLQAKILILQGQHESAQAPLREILAKEPSNADAHYNMGLTWQQGPRANYNNARNAYLAALKAEPRYAAARYNLVVLCLEHGVLDEAAHHAQTFAKEFPQDSRGANLDKIVAAASAKAADASAEKTIANGGK